MSCSSNCFSIVVVRSSILVPNALSSRSTQPFIYCAIHSVLGNNFYSVNIHCCHYISFTSHNNKYNYLIWSDHIQSDTIWSSPVLYCSVQSCPDSVLVCPLPSCPEVYCSALSCPVPFCPVLVCPALYYPIHSYHNLSFSVTSCPILSYANMLLNKVIVVWYPAGPFGLGDR